MGDVVITNDGATILKEMDIEHPAAKMIIEIAKTQEQHCYDGTTSAVVIAGELLKRSEDLVEQNVHPTVICEGFRLAADKAAEIIDAHAISVTPSALEEVAKTALKSAQGKRGSKRLEYYLPYSDSISSRLVNAFPWLLQKVYPLFRYLGEKGRVKYIRKFDLG